jgi:hypothetical protein
LAAIGAGELGFRVAGKREDGESYALVAAEMRIGLQQVTRQRVPVDAWRFAGANLTVAPPDRSSVLHGVSIVRCYSPSVLR